MEYDTNFEIFLLQNNIICRLIDLPVYIKGLTVKRPEYYCVLINAKFDEFTRKKTLLHEIAHIDLGHLELDDIALKYPELEAEVLKYIN